MPKFMSLTIGILLMLSAQLTQANISVDFTESAPKDRFTIKNEAACTLNDVAVTIDLSSSAGQLIFDTSARGAGVEVFQPFEIRKGEIELVSAAVQDGDTSLSIRLPSLPSGGEVSFTIDVDDTLPQSDLGQIRVSGAEIAQGQIAVRVGTSAPINAAFGSDSKATVVLAACPT